MIFDLRKPAGRLGDSSSLRTKWDLLGVLAGFRFYLTVVLYVRSCISTHTIYARTHLYTKVEGQDIHLLPPAKLFNLLVALSSHGQHGNMVTVSTRRWWKYWFPTAPICRAASLTCMPTQNDSWWLQIVESAVSGQHFAAGIWRTMMAWRRWTPLVMFSTLAQSYLRHSRPVVPFAGLLCSSIQRHSMACAETDQRRPSETQEVWGANGGPSSWAFLYCVIDFDAPFSP